MFSPLEKTAKTMLAPFFGGGKTPVIYQVAEWCLHISISWFMCRFSYPWWIQEFKFSPFIGKVYYIDDFESFWVFQLRPSWCIQLRVKQGSLMKMIYYVRQKKQAFKRSQWFWVKNTHDYWAKNHHISHLIESTIPPYEWKALVTKRVNLRHLQKKNTQGPESDNSSDGFLWFLHGGIMWPTDVIRLADSENAIWKAKPNYF